MTEYTAQQIADFVKSGPGPNSLFTSGEIAQTLAAKHLEARDMMERLQTAMSEAWSGNAAGQAQAGAGPLLAASEVSALHLSAAQRGLATQGTDYVDLKNKVGDGPGPKPEEDFLSRNFPVLTHKDEEIADWNAKAQEVVQHYSTYNGQSTDNAAGLPQDYGDLTLPSGGADVEHADKSATVTPPGDHRTVTDRTTQVDHRGTSGQDVSWQQQRPTGHTETPSGTNTGPDDTTRTSGLTPVADTGRSPSGGTSGWNLPGQNGQNTGGGFGRDGGSGDINARLGTGPGLPVTSGPGGTGRFGTPGTGSGSGTGSEPGSGRSGSGRLGEPGNARGGTSGPGGRSGASSLSEPGAAARSGAAGRSGRPGAPGMGALGQGGRKEEDKEHKRLEILQEPDPDELFGGFPDGMKPVPPTIGT